MIKLPVKIDSVTDIYALIRDADGILVSAFYGETRQECQNGAKAIRDGLNAKSAPEVNLERNKAILKADLETIQFTLNRAWETLIKLNE